MEELRSTEILDKEIEADARKKAEKILAKTELECKKILDAVPLRIETAKNELIQFYNEKVELFHKDKEASLPLEKERFLVSFIQTAINSKINDYLELLTEEKRINLVLDRSKNYLNTIKEKNINAYVYGFDIDLVKKILQKDYAINLKSCEKTDFNKLIVEDDCGIKHKEGIILESSDKLVRLRLTLSELVSQIEDEYRNELYDALFNGSLK